MSGKQGSKPECLILKKTCFSQLSLGFLLRFLRQGEMPRGSRTSLRHRPDVEHWRSQRGVAGNPQPKALKFVFWKSSKSDWKVWKFRLLLKKIANLHSAHFITPCWVCEECAKQLKPRSWRWVAMMDRKQSNSFSMTCVRFVRVSNFQWSQTFKTFWTCCLLWKPRLARVEAQQAHWELWKLQVTIARANHLASWTTNACLQQLLVVNTVNTKRLDFYDTPFHAVAKQICLLSGHYNI